MRHLVFILAIALLFWSSSISPCMGRRGNHWKKVKGKNHATHHKPKSKPKPKFNKPPPVTPTEPPPPKQNAAIFNVRDFGAVGDGTSDDTQSFLAAWVEACKVEASTVLVPGQYAFLVGPISFSGPYCKPDIVFQLDGTIIAPTNPGAWNGGTLQWIEFTKLKGITIQGSGTIEGSGSVWWQGNPNPDPAEDITKLIFPQNTSLQERPFSLPEASQLSVRLPSIKPTALRFYGSVNVTVTGITIQNSPQFHLKFDTCTGVVVHDITVNSPGDSPNTDGIHFQNTQNALVHTADIACGDDCISIQTGCSNVYVHNVNCGPGHGISIGSLGRDNTKACVSNVTVRDVNLHNTMTGVRIKTWQGGAGSVQNVRFSNIQVSEVQLPIVIDQYYCDRATCKNQSSAVALSGISYESVQGTYTVKPMHFACSDSMPCVDVSLNNIELKALQKGYHLYNPYCWQAFGEIATPTTPPLDCIRDGRPVNRRIDAKAIC